MYRKKKRLHKKNCFDNVVHQSLAEKILMNHKNETFL